MTYLTKKNVRFSLHLQAKVWINLQYTFLLPCSYTTVYTMHTEHMAKKLPLRYTVLFFHPAGLLQTKRLLAFCVVRAVPLSSSGPSCRTGICQLSEISHFCCCAILNENNFVLQFSQLEPVLSSGMQCFGEGFKAERWLLHSLQSHILSAQLKPLLQHRANIQKYYNSTTTSTHQHFVCIVMVFIKICFRLL